MKYITAKQLSYPVPSKPWRQSVAWVGSIYIIFALMLFISLNKPLPIIHSAPQAQPIAIELADTVLASKQQNLSEPEQKTSSFAKPEAAKIIPKVLTSTAKSSEEPIITPKPHLKPTAPTVVVQDQPTNATKPTQESASAALNIAQPTEQVAERSTTTQLSSPSQASQTEATAQWRNSVLAKLEQMKRYPAYAQREKQQDVIMLRFSLDAKGQLLKFDIQQSKGYELLDREVRALVKRAAPYPAPPAAALKNGVVDIEVPINFFIK